MELTEAKRLALELAERLGSEPADLGSALGRVAAGPVTADRDIPGNARSRWDGFALGSGDCRSACQQEPVVLKIAPWEAAAGKKPGRAGGGACVKIMTGAVLPAGADAVIRFEDASTCEGGLILTGPVRPGLGVIAPGSDARRGDLLLRDGDVLTPTRIAFAAATGRLELRVTRRPRVAILATGDELREAGRSDEAASIFCNNIHLFANLVRLAGGEPVELGAAPDDPAIILSRLEKAEADLVITTGGMGGGSRDFMPQVWKRLGLKTHFDRLNLVPGKGSALATGDRRIFLAFPGNPRAGRIVYEEIAAPMIRRFLGVKTGGDFALNARTLRPIRKKEGFHQAFEGIVRMEGAFCSFAPNRIENAENRSRISFLGNGLAYSILAPEDTYVARGKKVRVKVPDFSLVSWAALLSNGGVA